MVQTSKAWLLKQNTGKSLGLVGYRSEQQGNNLLIRLGLFDEKTTLIPLPGNRLKVGYGKSSSIVILLAKRYSFQVSCHCLRFITCTWVIQ